MNTTIVTMKINAALNVLTRVQALAPTLTKKQQREMPLASIAAAIRGLELAKAEIDGQAWPVAPLALVDVNFDPAELIDN